LGSYGSYLFTALTQAGLPYGARFAIALLGSLAVIVPIAYLYAKYVDEPAIRFSGYFYRRLFTNHNPTDLDPALEAPQKRTIIEAQTKESPWTSPSAPPA
jgi:peptidoglycan/LPS O-acetylase OafA/YrhL